MFSYADYKEILRIIKEIGTQATYKEALTRDKFIIMRHDVEYSVERAFELSRIEESMDFHSHYFFQWTNNSYNVLSRKNRDLITEMHERGQHIGLHFALNGMTDVNLIRERILKEAEMFSNMLGFEITNFSFHRPSPDVLAANLKFSALLNAYQDDFFTFMPDASSVSEPHVKYLSDANHIWRYGYPDEETLWKYPRVQILAHPFAWSQIGGDNLANYIGLVREKYVELLDSIDNECKDFGPLRDHFKNGPHTTT